MYECSIDKVTFTHELKPGMRYYVDDYLRSNPVRYSQKFANFPYRKALMFDDGTRISVAEKLEKIQGWRYEFNPNKCNAGGVLRWIKEFVNKDTINLTRVDYAIDIKDIKINDYYVMGRNGTSHINYYGRTGELETKYIGSKNSDKRWRLYNKRLEILAQTGIDIGREITRLELQLRDNCLLSDNEKVFTELLMLRDLSINLGWENTAKIEYLLRDENNWSKLAKHSKLKYQKMIKENMNTIIDIGAILEKEKESLTSMLDSWLKPRYKKIKENYFHDGVNPMELPVFDYVFPLREDSKNVDNQYSFYTRLVN